MIYEYGLHKQSKLKGKKELTSTFKSRAEQCRGAYPHQDQIFLQLSTALSTITASLAF